MTRLIDMRRLRRRGPVIVANTANSLIVPFFGVFVSLLVVRLASVDLWGAFVDVMIVVQLVAHVVGWGNKEYLLRAFSFNPADLAQQWQTSLVTRLALFVPFVALFGLLGYPALQWALAVIWCLGQVLYQSNDVLILYRKDFVYSIVVELVSIGLLIAAVAWQGPRLTVNSLIAWFALTTWLKAGAFFFRFRSHTMQRWVGRFYPQFFRAGPAFLSVGFFRPTAVARRSLCRQLLSPQHPGWPIPGVHQPIVVPPSGFGVCLDAFRQDHLPARL